MFTRRTRLLIISASIILGAWTIYQQVYEITSMILMGICLLVWGYFYEGTVIMAARAFHTKQYAQAERLLKDIKYPVYLGKHRRSFYEFIYGSIELQRGNFDKAEQHFLLSNNFPLRNSNHQGTVLVHLANINLRKNDIYKAQIYLGKAQKLKVTSRLNQIIETIRQECLQLQGLTEKAKTE